MRARRDGGCDLDRDPDEREELYHWNGRRADDWRRGEGLSRFERGSSLARRWLVVDSSLFVRRWLPW